MIRLLFLTSVSLFLVRNSNGSILPLTTQSCPSNTTVISSAPYTISSSDTVYCLSNNLIYSTTSGYAITINTNVHDVTIDLNGFRIIGDAAGSATTATGIYGQNLNGVAIRNGSISGFMYGIRLDDSSSNYTNSSDIIIENLRVRRNTFRGIRTQGSGTSILNNQVINTGPTTFYSNAYVQAIESFGPGVRVYGNLVSNTTSTGSTAEAVGISLSSASSGAVVENNSVLNSNLPTSGNGTSWAIWVGGNTTYPTEALVINNKITSFTNGVAFSSPTHGVYKDNQTHGCTTPFLISSTDVTNAGNNN